jgi:proline iminopeptidase
LPSEPIRLHVDARGEGPAVLFLHGFAGSARNWRVQTRALSDRYRTIAYDARGHARSEAPEDPRAYGADALVRDALGVLAGQGAARAVWVGLSMGSAVALEAAIRAPEAVRALVLAAPPAGRGGGGISGHAAAFADAIERDGLEAAGERFAWGPPTTLSERDAAWVRQGFLEHPPHGLVHTLRGFLALWPPPRERAAELARVRVPALVVAGSLDGPGTASARELGAALPRARVEIVEGAGHVVNLARPAEFGALLEAFLAAHAPAAR